MKIRAVLCVSSLLALYVACGGRSTEEPKTQATDETLSVPSIGLRSSLPSCSESTTGNVYYVVRDGNLVYCDGRTYQDVELESAPNWLVSAGTAASCAHGGAKLSAGPDANGNGKLDMEEIVASAAACNAPPSAGGTAGAGGGQGTGGAGGAAGAPGLACPVHEVASATGCVCVAGYVRASATAPCTGLPPGATKPTGEDQPCSNDADCAGFEATFCDVFVSQTCLVRNCTVAPNSCFTGKECCDLSDFGLPMTLCIAEGACVN